MTTHEIALSADSPISTVNPIKSQEVGRFAGKPYPLGATWDIRGTNFALFSKNATKVELLLFANNNDPQPNEIIPINEKTNFVWHCYLRGIAPGQLYGYRVYGPYDPEKGLRFNPKKTLIDPYAKALSGKIQWNDALFGYKIGDPRIDMSFDERDSTPFIPKSVVVDTSFDWEGDRLLDIPWNETIIYELHVKGFTKSNKAVDPKIQGTYAGLASPPSIDYLKSLGITAVELLPVHQAVDDRSLVEKGLTNYWGYNTIGFFSPDSRYSSSGDVGGQVGEFKQMVKALHKAGIEVILDVVYNHTGEGNHFGPTLSFKGIDNPSYYHLSPQRPRYYMDFTGTGNSLGITHPYVMQLLMDSLRYWILEMHVDGFRFDLAATLARKSNGVDRLSTFFDIVQQDPVVSQVKLIAEPWDLGHDGYQLGKFPPLWAEWNGKYRDLFRRFWKGDACLAAELAHRVSGSSDLFGENGRTPCASINYVVSHDGFTLDDLVSYNVKHNEPGRNVSGDGTEENLSWNSGIEGPTKDALVSALREQQKKNFLATLLLSQGIPMICAGDEHGRTQRGDNNPYSGDNENFWIDWNLDDKQLGLLDFTKKLIRVRKEHPVFRHKKYFGEVRPGIKQAIFYDTAGNELNVFNWQQPSINSFSLLLRGDAIEVAPKPDTKETVLRIAGRSFVLLCKKRVEAKPVETLPMETKHPPLKLRKRLSPKPMSLRKAAPVRSVKPSVQKRKKKAGERRTNKTVPVKKHGKRTLAKKVASAKMLKNRRSHI